MSCFFSLDSQAHHTKQKDEATNKTAQKLYFLQMLTVQSQRMITITNTKQHIRDIIRTKKKKESHPIPKESIQPLHFRC
jgi:hypothetical protein